MSRAVPWSVKGVDFDAREAAKEAARRSGMPVGEWLNAVIGERAQDLGISLDDLEEDERIAAVADRVARGARRGDLAHAARRRADPRDMATEEAPAARRRATPAPQMRGDRDNLRRSESSWDDQPRRAARRRAEPTRDEDSFFDAVARRIELAFPAQPDRSGAALDEVSLRLAAIERRLEEVRAERDGDRDGARAIGDLDRRLERLGRELKAGEHDAPKAAAADLARIEAKLDRLAATPNPAAAASGRASDGAAARMSPSRVPLSQAVAEIAQRRSELEAGGARSSGHKALEPAPVARLKSEISQLSDALAAMRAEAQEASLAPRSSAVPLVDMAELKDTIATLADAVSDLRAATRAPQPANSEIAKLHKQMDAIGHAMAELAPRETVASLEEAISELSSRVSASRSRDGMRESVVAPIEGLILDLKRSLADFAPAESFAAVEHQLSAMAGILESMAQGAVDADLLERVRNQTNEIHALLLEAAARPVPLANVERQIHELSERVERIVERGASQAGTDAISERIEAIRDELERNSPAQLVQTLEARMDALSRRFDEAIEAKASAPQIEALGERLENMMRDVQASLERQRHGPAEVAQLQTLVRQLSQRVEQAILSGCSPSALGVIEGQIGEIVERLDFSNKSPQNAEQLERLIQAMTQRLEQPISSSQLEEVQETVRALVQRFGFLAETPAALRALESRIEAIAARLDEPVKMDLDLSRIETMIEDLPRRIEHARGEDAASAPASLEPQFLKSLESRIGAMASRLDEPVRMDIDLTRLETMIEDLPRRIERARGDDAASAPASLEPQFLKSLESRIGAMASRLDEPVSVELDTSRLEAMIEDIATRLDGTRGDDGSELQKTVHALLERLEDATRQAPDAARLESMMLEIASRLDRPSLSGESARQLDQLITVLAGKFDSSGADAEQSHAYQAIHEQIQSLAARIDGLDNSAAVTHLEQTVGDVFAQIDQFREAALAGAELAARTVALEALSSIERNADASPDAGVRDLLTQEIAQLRAIHDASDRRTSATLNAVHETLEKVVDRLAMLETDLESASSAEPAPATEHYAASLRQSSEPASRLEAAMAAAPAPHVSPTPPPRVEQLQVEQLQVEQLKGAQLQVEPRRAAPEPAPSFEPLTFAPAQPEDDALGRALGQPAEPAGVAQKALPGAAPLPHPVELGADLLLEPGSGSPARRTGAAAVRKAAPPVPQQSPEDHPAGSQASFIAAVRRAQQAATAAQQQQQQQPAINAARFDGAVDPARPRRRPGGQLQEANTSAVSRAMAFISGRKRQVLFSLAGLALVLGALQFIRSRGDLPEERPAVQGRLETPTTKLTQAAPSAPIRATERATRFTTSGSFGPPPTFTASNADPSPVASIAAGSAPAANSLKTRALNTDLRANAASGMPEAQYALAARYADGKGVQHLAQAAALFEKAAGQNLAPAQYRLGALYEKGLGVPKDPQKARDLYRQAADQGHVKAMHNLAVILADSSLGQPDYAAAATWFRKAAEHGVRDSQYNLAILHARGLGTSQSLAESYVWFSIAASQGDVDAGKKRADVAARLDTRQLALARANVDSFKPIAPDPSANEVLIPAGGWRLEPSKEPSPARPGARPRISSL